MSDENWNLGQTSKRYETGNRGAATISTGKGDHGGVSYGEYQLSTNMGTLREYLSQSEYGNSFSGLIPATPQFNAKWRELAGSDSNFAIDQHNFIKKTHYYIQVNGLKVVGIDLSERGPAVQDALWSTSVQFRTLTRGIFQNGLIEKFGPNYDISSLSDKDIVTAVQDYKIAHNSTLFRKSPTQWESLINRAKEEKSDLIELATNERSIGIGASQRNVSANNDNILRQGESGESIRKLQHQLNAAGYVDAHGQKLTEDGSFGARTRESVEAFQRAAHLKVDGIVGPQTLTALKSTENVTVEARVNVPTPTQTSGQGAQNFNDVMRTVLPTQQGVSPHITSRYGAERGVKDHGGVDFNYVGGQNGINMRHPTVHAPISGTVTFVGGEYGTVKIKDAQGNSHEILHMQTQSVKIGQSVHAGDPIGTMGGRGPDGSSDYAQHVHYQLKNSAGRIMNPENFWNNQQQTQVHGANTTPTTTVNQNGVQPKANTLLKQGDNGEGVLQLQGALNNFGYRDASGNPLRQDGKFGEHTQEAVQAYQLSHGLKVDGIVGPQTMGALTRSSNEPLLSNPSHPQNAMYQQALSGLEKLGRGVFQNRYALENAAGALVFDARASGLKSIDHVLQNTNKTGFFALEGAPGNPDQNRAYIDKAQAISQPIEQSTFHLQQEGLNIRQQQANLQQERQQNRSVMM